MFAKKIFAALIMAAFIATQFTTAGAAAGPKKKIEGTWLVTATINELPEVPPFKVLFTFMPGRSDDEGTLVDTNEAELAAPGPICTPDQGVWERKGSREFIATHLTFCFEFESGIPAGPAKVRDIITLSDDGEEFTGRQFVEAFDASGQLVFTANILMHGVRLHAEAPPPLP